MLCMTSVGKDFKSGLEGKERALHFPHLFRKSLVLHSINFLLLRDFIHRKGLIPLVRPWQYLSTYNILQNSCEL